MTPNLWVIVIIVATTIVSFSIAYIQRKQMQRVEVQSIDTLLRPSPRSRFRFFRQNWWEMILVVAAGYASVRWFIEDSQRSYHAGVSAAVSVWLLTILMFTIVFTLVFDGVRQTTELQAEQFRSMTDLKEKQLLETAVMSGVIRLLITELEKAGQLTSQASHKIASELDKWGLPARPPDW
jgi:hypothetical protein